MAIDIVVFINQQPNEVTIEVKRGNDDPPESNPNLAPITLSSGEQSEPIYSAGENIYYRQVDPPYDNIWIDRPCYGLGENYEVAL